MIRVIFKVKNRLYQFNLLKADELLNSLDKILKKNKIGITDLKYFKLVFKGDVGFLGRRILQAFSLALKLSQKQATSLSKKRRARY